MFPRENRVNQIQAMLMALRREIASFFPTMNPGLNTQAGYIVAEKRMTARFYALIERFKEEVKCNTVLCGGYRKSMGSFEGCKDSLCRGWGVREIVGVELSPELSGSGPQDAEDRRCSSEWNCLHLGIRNPR